MTVPLAHLEFTLDDEIDGRPLTPANVDLPTLRGFLVEVEKLIKGKESEASLSGSHVHIEEGSVKLVAAVAATLAASVTADLSRLSESNDLDQVQAPRAEVFASWQARARRHPARVYLARGVGEQAPVVRIASETQVEHRSENAWVNVEKYVTGRVLDMGGKSPNVHLVIPGQRELLRVAATDAQLEGKPHLYREVTLRLTAEQHLQTGALRSAHLVEFLPVSQEVDEQALARLWKKGREAWQNVTSTTGWVEELRGT